MDEYAVDLRQRGKKDHVFVDRTEYQDRYQDYELCATIMVSDDGTLRRIRSSGYVDY